MAKYILTI